MIATDADYVGLIGSKQDEYSSRSAAGDRCRLRCCIECTRRLVWTSAQLLPKKLHFPFWLRWWQNDEAGLVAHSRPGVGIQPAQIRKQGEDEEFDHVIFKLNVSLSLDTFLAEDFIVSACQKIVTIHQRFPSFIN